MREELLEWKGESIEWFNEQALKDTEESLKLYYSGKADEILKCFVECAFRRCKDDPAFQVLPLTYEKQWHAEHIAKHFKCKEKMIPKLLDKMIKQVALGLYGVDALDIYL